MIETIIVAVFSLIGTLGGAYLASRKTTALVAYRLEQLEDMVFRTREDGLRGTELLCTYEQISGAQMMAVYESALHELGVETEETINEN